MNNIDAIVKEIQAKSDAGYRYVLKADNGEFLEKKPASLAHELPRLLQGYTHKNVLLRLDRPNGSMKNGEDRYREVKQWFFAAGSTPAMVAPATLAVENPSFKPMALHGIERMDIHTQYTFNELTSAKAKLERDLYDLQKKYEKLYEEKKELEHEVLLKDKQFDLEKEGQLSGLDRIVDRHPELLSKALDIFGPSLAPALGKLASGMVGASPHQTITTEGDSGGVVGEFNRLVPSLDHNQINDLSLVLQVYQNNVGELMNAATAYRQQMEEYNKKMAREAV